ncbi:hypothetical protein AB6D16_009265 [Vibrio cyclitrophicus]|uniref:hypothetical protein n=1 Tax=Vibrio sp. F13 TaxID=2070777 RepID=UPI0010BD5D7B|nr:hypothetical protein [Vibrio sp. F13]TKG04209.1 hypothetical protein FCV76_03650 [Vibrio sp. F13]
MSKEIGQLRHWEFRKWISEMVNESKSCKSSIEKILDTTEVLNIDRVILTDAGISALVSHISNQTNSFSPQRLADALGFPNRENIRKSGSIKADLKVLEDYLLSHNHIAPPKERKQGASGSKSRPENRHSAGNGALEAENAVLKERVAELEGQLRNNGKASRFADVIAKHGVVFIEER